MSQTSKNILITGADGFVGRALTKRLLGESRSLFLVSRNKKLKVTGAKVFYGDLNDNKFCQRIIKRIDTVYYLAGYKKNIAYHTKYPNDFVLGNIGPLTSFLKAVRDSSIKKIIYLSSTHVGLYKEDEEDGYILGKYINELILKSFSEQSGVDVKIVRSPGIYGPGDNFDPETANFVPAIINRIYESNNEMQVWGAGNRKMQLIFIDDLISNLVEISRSGKKFFVVGNPESLTINSITEKLVKLSGKSLIIRNNPTKPDKPTQLFEFGNQVSPKFDFDSGLRKTMDYYKAIQKT